MLYQVPDSAELIEGLALGQQQAEVRRIRLFCCKVQGLTVLHNPDHCIGRGPQARIELQFLQYRIRVAAALKHKIAEAIQRTDPDEEVIVKRCAEHFAYRAHPAQKVKPLLPRPTID